MGERVQVSPGATVSPAELQARLDRSVLALRRMVAEGFFDTAADTCGLEVELDLVDPLGRPRQINDKVLAALGRSDFQVELGRFNIELNVEPRPVHGGVLRALEDELAAVLDEVSATAAPLGARAISVGTLPTLHADDLTARYLSSNPRYSVLDVAMSEHRGHPVVVDISGRERLWLQTDSIAVQSAATSLQVHLRVSPTDFPRFYNAAQAVAPAQVAAGANSAYLLGRQLWHETRIALIEQSLDIRSASAPADEPPRTWAGNRWASSAVDLLADNVRLFAPLLGVVDAEDPLAELDAGRVPSLHELRLHNGTVWRWNRPVYDVQHGHPQLRIENRVLPSGPTAADMAANTALFLGLVRAVADDAQPVSVRMPFGLVPVDLVAAARLGLGATLHWPGPRRVESLPARGLLLDVLLPLAADGLDRWGVAPADRDEYLGLVADRVRSGRTGAVWQVATVSGLEARGWHREGALREMVRRYVDNARTREPVHRWPV
ncbi:MAG TPA: hypothetical protein VF314_16325 [Actinomycetes bacterium]